MADYTIVREDTDSIMAHVLDDGTVEVHMPFEATEQDAEFIVNKYRLDIEKSINMKKRAVETRQNINYSFRPLLLGKRYSLVKSKDVFCGFSLKDERFYVIPGLRQYQLKNFLKNFYTKIGYDVFSKRMKEFSERMGLRYDRFQISDSATPFGICTERGQLIELSWTLTMTDDDFIDSVIIHELAHLKYDDHFSAEFTKLVKTYCPDYDEIQKRGTDYEIMLRADGWIKMKLSKSKTDVTQKEKILEGAI